MRRMFALLLFPLTGFAAELELRYVALERILAAQLFTAEGRHYVRGSRATPCQSAYLEKPRLDSDGGKLRLRARFSGRAALDLFGGCVGLGDSFDLTMTASPFPRHDAIVLSDISITTAKDSYYIRRVRLALAQSIARDFKIDVREHARKLLDTSGGSYQQELGPFEIAEIRVTPEAMVLVMDFRVIVK